MTPAPTALLFIDVVPMPDVRCSEPRALSLGLQSGARDIVGGTASPRGVHFEVEVRVKPARDGSPDFGGPLAHGRPGERFLYLSWGTVTADDHHAMFRRLKIYLTPVTRAGWSSPGVSWEQLRGGHPVATTVSGRGPDGTPSCGTAPAVWRVVRTREEPSPHG